MNLLFVLSPKTNFQEIFTLLTGFFNPGLGHKVANYALMDQLAALHWLQENVGQFGGDPARVTVFGSGRGAAALNFLMMSPATRGTS